MPLPGFVKLYNRFPTKFEFTCNMRPFTLEPHSEEVVTYDMAILAIKQSMYKITMDGNPLFGVVVPGDPEYGNPLVDSDLHTGDPVKDNTIEFVNPEEMFPVKVSMAGVQPVTRKPLTRDYFVAGKSGNVQ